MPSIRASVGAGVFILIVLAGCADLPARGAQAPADPGAASMSMGHEGSITGRILDDEQRPVVHAEVGIPELASSAQRSDTEGRFTINKVPAGAYLVYVEKLGYKTTAKAVKVLAAETTQLEIRLEPIPVPAARHEDFYVSGRLDYAASVPGYSLYNGVERDFYWDIEPGAASAVSAMRWDDQEPTAPNYMYLDIWVTTNNCGGVCDLIERALGGSPLYVRTGASYQEAMEDLDKGHQFNTYFGIVACGAVSTAILNCDPGEVVQVSVDKRFDVYATVFFLEPGPAGHDPLPPE